MSTETMPMVREKTVLRLGESKKAHDEKCYSNGKDIGETWARDTADYGQLERLARWWSECKHAKDLFPFTIPPLDERLCASAIAKAIDPKWEADYDGIGRTSVGTFFKTHITSHLERNELERWIAEWPWCYGFCEGAVEVLKEVESKG